MEIHTSHKMTEWRAEIRAPAGTARFYGVRNCAKCGGEEMKHPAGHFIDKWLYDPCVPDNNYGDN